MSCLEARAGRRRRRRRRMGVGRSVGGAPLPHVAGKGGRRRRRSLALREGGREGAREEGGEETKMRGKRRKGKGIRAGKGSKTQT